MALVEAVERSQRDRKAADTVIAALAARFGNRLVTSQAVREQHGHTTTWIENQPPDAVVFPQTTEDVQDVVRLCAAHRVPVIAFGTGTSLEGQVNAPRGGICLDFRDMNRVLAVHAEDLDCVIEPGITRKQLNEHLRDQGVFFPIDPGADASLGGMAATRGSGTNAVRYGTMKDNVLALKVVLANGEVMSTARRAKKSSAGYDLTRLMVGAEGTLGIITELTLRLSGIPEAIVVGHLPVPVGRGGVQCDHPRHPVRHSGGAHRIARCAASEGLQPLFKPHAAGNADAVFGVSRHRRQRRRTVGALRRHRQRARRRTVRLGDARRGPQPSCGRRGTTPIGRRADCGRARRRCRPTFAFRSRGSRNASPQPSATPRTAASSRRSSAMSATATSTCC